MGPAPLPMRIAGDPVAKGVGGIHVCGGWPSTVGCDCSRRLRWHTRLFSPAACALALDSTLPVSPPPASGSATRGQCAVRVDLRVQ